MKRYYYLLMVIVLVSFYSRAQIVDIPDLAFKNILINVPCVDTNNDGSPDTDADTNDDGEIQITEAEVVIGLYVHSISIASLEGLQYFINLEVFHCSESIYTSINVSTLDNLRELVIDHNNLTSIDLSQNTNLIKLLINGNMLTSLDMSQNLSLEILYCHFNQLNSLNISQNYNLFELRCEYNQLSNLDVTQNMNLEKLSFGNNNISNIDISHNLNLVYLNLWNTLITDLDLSQNLNLLELHLVNNEISELDISQNINIELLDILGCNFISFDISQHPNIKLFRSEDNQLTSLNLQNGNNDILNLMRTQGNPDLTCIQVDDVEFANNHPEWIKDETAVYSEDCLLSVSESYLENNILIYPVPALNILKIENRSNTEISFIKIYDVLGRLVLEEKGNVDQLDLSNINSGVLFIKINTDERVLSKKIIKI